MKRLEPALTVLALAILACNVPQPSSTPQVSSSSGTVTLTIYFLDSNRYAIGTEPYETAVSRTVPEPASLPEAVLTQLFLGPTEAEKNQGLAVVLSGATGFSQLSIEKSVARVTLTGTCNSGGATYTLAQLIEKNLLQFPEIKWVKIYDQNGKTEMPDGQSSSIPICLEP
jgi:hypothetical protein